MSRKPTAEAAAEVWCPKEVVGPSIAPKTGPREKENRRESLDTPHIWWLGRERVFSETGGSGGGRLRCGVQRLVSGRGATARRAVRLGNRRRRRRRLARARARRSDLEEVDHAGRDLVERACVVGYRRLRVASGAVVFTTHSRVTAVYARAALSRREHAPATSSSPAATLAAAIHPVTSRVTLFEWSREAIRTRHAIISRQHA